MAYSQVEIREYCRKLGKSESTLWRWIRQGCDLRNPKSVAEWVTRNTIRETNISKAQKRRRDGNQAAQRTRPARDPGAVEHSGNGELAAPGRRGAAHALARLELQEEESYRRLQAVLASGDPFAVDAAQSFWLRVAEVLRRLDRELELSRRSEQEMIPLKDATDAIVAVSEWTRIALVTLLSAEGVTLAAGFKSIGEFKAYFVQRLHGVLTLTIKSADRTRSPVPSWAKRAVWEAWNITPPTAAT